MGGMGGMGGGGNQPELSFSLSRGSPWSLQPMQPDAQGRGGGQMVPMPPMRMSQEQLRPMQGYQQALQPYQSEQGGLRQAQHAQQAQASAALYTPDPTFSLFDLQLPLSGDVRTGKVEGVRG